MVTVFYWRNIILLIVAFICIFISLKREFEMFLSSFWFYAIFLFFICFLFWFVPKGCWRHVVVVAVAEHLSWIFNSFYNFHTTACACSSCLFLVQILVGCCCMLTILFKTILQKCCFNAHSYRVAHMKFVGIFISLVDEGFANFLWKENLYSLWVDEIEWLCKQYFQKFYPSKSNRVTLVNLFIL